MQVSRWGNSLAVRLPARVVQALGLKEGEDVQVEVSEEIAGKRRFAVRRTITSKEASARLDALSTPLPPGFRFNREEANER